MINIALILKNDRGSTIIIAVMILVFLTIIGIAATNTSIFESKIVGNDHRYQIEFYVADSGWKQGAMWLESLAGPPAEVVVERFLLRIALVIVVKLLRPFFQQIA